MPKRHGRKSLKGGFWPFSSSTSSSNTPTFSSNTPTNASNPLSWFSSNSSKPKRSFSFSSNNYYTPNKQNPFGSSSYVPPTRQQLSQSYGYGTYGNNNFFGMGGKGRTRKMKGGYKDSSPTTGIAVNAGSFSGQTARPNTWVGGKTRKRGGKNTRRNRKH